MLVSFLVAGSLKVPCRFSTDLRILFKNTCKGKETDTILWNTLTLCISIAPSTDEFRKINELIFNAPVRLLIICYHFPHFSEVKWPRATKEDCGRLENKTQISWLPVLSLCLFPEQPLGRQQSLVNYFVFIRVGIIVPFSHLLSQD